MFKRRHLRIALWVFPAAILAVLLLQNTQRAKAPAEPEATAAQESASPEPTPAERPESTAEPKRKYAGQFELPLEGATGFASVDLNLRSGAGTSHEKTGTIAAGSGFRILGEEGDFWLVSDGASTGYVAHRYCMVNLPDIIPSIVYDNTNAYESKILSSGREVPGITGEAIYENTAYNERLGREEFIMPVLYSMAGKIQSAQRAALADGNSLKIYEAFRPYQAQRRVVDAMADLSARDSVVRAGVSTDPWKVSWFISQGISHHQRGCAIDVSLVQVDRTEIRSCGPYSYEAVSACTEYEMPTQIHELSIAAAVFDSPVPSFSRTAWRSAAPAKTVNNSARLLQKYCTDAGMTPLASEWWHFNDLESYEGIRNSGSAGEYVLRRVYSAPPETA